MENDFYAWAAVLGVWFRYNLGYVKSCKTVGDKLAGEGGSYQNAITPSYLTNLSIVCWVLIAIFGIATAYYIGWIGVLKFVGIFIVVSVLTGLTVIPKPESKYFVNRIFKSLVKRRGVYDSKNDLVRSVAVGDLILVMIDTYSDLLEPPK